jgi:NADH-quinone oxidoreductase subunit C/D
MAEVIDSHNDPAQELTDRFGPGVLTRQQTKDSVPTFWVAAQRLHEVLTYLKHEAVAPYEMLYDLTAIDERVRRHREGQPAGDFSVVYHLLSFERNQDIRIKTALSGDTPSTASITSIFRAADWYEREAWDMFNIRFDGHPNLRRILLPSTWQGHPLRKDYPARATDRPPYQLDLEKQLREEDALKFRPQQWGLQTAADGVEYLFLNLGPHHPGAHGVLRLVLQLDGEEIVDVVPDIGFHHRGAEKMGERQTWHRYIPYTDRVDYLGGVMNNLPYVLAVEKLAGIEVPARVQVIRVMMAELFRIYSHLIWYGTFAQDLGQLSPVFYMFNDRERILDIVSAVTGGRMHPNWFRIGGVAQDLPEGWDALVRGFVDYLPGRLAEYDRLVMRNSLFKARTQGIGGCTLQEAVDWGMTGPNLRACGLSWDFRKMRPYSGYENFEFEIPTAEGGHCFARAKVRVAEMHQSLRIIRQCLENMPAGEHKADHPLTTPPLKKYTLHDIETLITHFLGVTWGPVIPAGEAAVGVEATKGNNTYYLISDGSNQPYRVRIRTPSFAHIQMVPLLSRGLMVPDLMAILGSLDFVLADVDR